MGLEENLMEKEFSETIPGEYGWSVNNLRRKECDFTRSKLM